jgi:hypothetical protein
MDSRRRRVKGDGLASLFDDDSLRYLGRGEVVCVDRLDRQTKGPGKAQIANFTGNKFEERLVWHGVMAPDSLAQTIA